MNVRVRGIYATALTRRFLAAGHEVVQASDPIRRRFDDPLSVAPADVAVETTGDRLGVGLVGDPDAVETAGALLSGLAVDALRIADPAPRGAVFDAAVVDTPRSGATVDLGERAGFLPYSKVDDRVEEGDVVRVQVHEPAAPWTDDRPVLGESRRADGGLATLRDDLDGTVVAEDVDDEAARELSGLLDLLDVETPPSWGVEWSGAAVDADIDALAAGLDRAVERATPLIGLDEERDPPRRLAAPAATEWCWFGRESRFALDGVRREVTATMAGHHRIKAGDRRASTAVDFVEAVCGSDGTSAGGSGDGEFPFGAVVDQFGPRQGDLVALEHGKPDGDLYVLGRGEVTDVEPSGKATVRRRTSGRGTYDALGTPREAGDTATTRLKEGRWWYATAYRGEDGERKGTYVNVCTPVEVFPDAIRYVDLYVDVVKYPDGTVEVVDEHELADAVEAGYVPPDLAGKAREVAGNVENALSE